MNRNEIASPQEMETPPGRGGVVLRAAWMVRLFPALLQDALELFVSPCELDEEFVGWSFSLNGDASCDGVSEDSDDVFACCGPKALKTALSVASPRAFLRSSRVCSMVIII